MTTKQVILDALKRLAGSMKVWTMLLGLITVIAAKKGFNVDPETFWVIVGAFATLLGVQGATDWGKSASTVAATNSMSMFNNSSSTLLAVKPEIRYMVNDGNKAKLLFSNGEEYDVSETLLAQAGYVKKQPELAIVPPQAGFASLRLTMVLGALALFVVCLSSASCLSSAQRTALKNGARNCLEENKQTLTKEFGPTVDMLITRAINPSTGQVDTTAIKEAAKNFTRDGGLCVLATSIAALLNPPKENAVHVSNLPVDKETLRAMFVEISGGEIYVTKSGIVGGR